MVSTKGKISVFQFFSLLYLARVLTTVTYIPSYTEGTAPSDMLLNVVLRIAFALVIIIPVFLLYKKAEDKNILDWIRERSALGAKVTAALYALSFFYFAVSTVARLDVFAGTVIFPETNVNYLLFFVAALCCYGAYLGFEALGRSAVLSLFLVVPALIFVVAALKQKMDFLNFSPMLYNGVSPLIKTALDAAGRTVEYAAVAVALPKVSGNCKKGYLFWIIANSLTAAVLFFMLTGVMGNFANTQLFPLHTLSSVAKFSLLERLDALFTGLWILCAFLKISFLIYLCESVLQKEFAFKNNKRIFVLLGALVTATNLFIAKSIDRFMILDNSKLKFAVTFTLTFAIPLIVLVSSIKRGGKKCEKQPSLSQ